MTRPPRPLIVAARRPSPWRPAHDPRRRPAGIDPERGRRARARPRQHRQPDRQRGPGRRSSSRTGSSANGFAPRRFALTEDRFNVAAWIDGSGGGYSLIYNAHLDTTLRPRRGPVGARPERSALSLGVGRRRRDLRRRRRQRQGPDGRVPGRGQGDQGRRLPAQGRPDRQRGRRRDLARADRRVAGAGLPEQGPRGAVHGHPRRRRRLRARRRGDRLRDRRRRARQGPLQGHGRDRHAALLHAVPAPPDRARRRAQRDRPDGGRRRRVRGLGVRLPAARTPIAGRPARSCRRPASTRSARATRTT